MMIQMMNDEEIYEKYKHLIIFEIDGVYKNKYVKLEEKTNENI